MQDPVQDPVQPALEATYDHTTLEAEIRARWERDRIYAFDPDAPGEVFSVDTPPPYVSAAHLHVGHAMSYTQAEIVVRYQRMLGKRVFYPMGFDDNGLPTERYVEKAHAVDKATLTRSAFRTLCLEETRRGAAAYEALWRSLGLSVDWSLRYSTIDEHCRRTAQASFLGLYRQGRIARAEAPVPWDPVLGTALAQADLELVERRTKLYTIAFRGPDGAPLPIATTRPELLPACVALYRHPEDPRYASLTEALVPLSDQEGAPRRVPVLADAEVDPAYGTGLLMVCTFGDAEDVRRWRRDRLPLRTIVGPDGRWTEAAGPYAGLDAASARARILGDLQARGAAEPGPAGFSMVVQRVPISDRTQALIEWRTAPSWEVRITDLQDRLAARSAELRWFPPHMKQRLDDWIDGLRQEWNLSRQRFYGVPFPVWLCEACGEAVLAEQATLPVDPLEDPPPCEACPRCGGALRGDPDVMDTWMTSSSTPAINGNLAGSPGRTACPHPMTLRVQAFEIVRTWLFYALVKAELHHTSLPFRDVMISGWGLDEQGHKISKRNLQPDASGFSRYDPGQLIAKLGADAVRHWAARTALGRDLRFSLADVKAGRRVAIKLWNAARLLVDLGAFGAGAAPALADRAPEDRHLLHTLDGALATARAGLDAYDYATGLHAFDRWCFGDLCDDWLEAAKDRARRPERYAPGDLASLHATGREAFRTILGAYAPYLPFVTDALWVRLYQAAEGGPSVHRTAYPAPIGAPAVPGIEAVAAVRTAVRRWRTERGVPQARELGSLVVSGPVAALAGSPGLGAAVLAACRVRSVGFEVDDGPLRVALTDA